ncbi:MAG: hypothetical protein JOZ08_22000 [Verrucomicrobia bacterium]|nr:hypothetical protein [Verrucomicrobiota bacterium]MBV8276014.1 hypothetical protein [Verrucomicrobiota bacterium]
MNPGDIPNANHTQEDTDAMKSGYPHFRLYTWIEDTQTWMTEEGRWKQLRRIPKNIRSDLKRGKCRMFSDLNGNDCYAKVDGVAQQHPYRSWLQILGLE